MTQKQMNRILSVLYSIRDLMKEEFKAAHQRKAVLKLVEGHAGFKCAERIYGKEPGRYRSHRSSPAYRVGRAIHEQTEAGCSKVVEAEHPYTCINCFYHHIKEEGGYHLSDSGCCVGPKPIWRPGASPACRKLVLKPVICY